MKKNKIKMFFIISIIGILAISSLTWTKNTSAAGKKFAISPMSQRIILIPGETYHGAITVATPSDATESFNYLVSVAPYSLERNETTDTDYGGSDFENIHEHNQIIEWISINNPEGTIKPNEQRTVSFTISVPEDVPAGGQYAALLIRENDNSAIVDNSVAIREVMQMAHIIYAEILGETRKEGEIVENTMPSFLLTNKLSASSTVKNNGNIHTDAKYVLQIWPLFSDEEIYTNEEEPEKILILPNATKYHNQEATLPSIGIFRVKQTVSIFDETSITEKTVIVCPLWLLFLIIFAIFAIIFWLFYRAKARKTGQARTQES